MSLIGPRRISVGLSAVRYRVRIAANSELEDVDERIRKKLADNKSVEAEVFAVTEGIAACDF